ncbi:MAG: FIST C-terminal domain-containing protein, partial [Elusimicrobia bacterium]|nr:FIST C-terminal domain-containing protein [Elusimicrobiota bacterium]
MRIGIGLGTGPDAAKAARSAARQALAGCPRPSLAIAFGGVRLDQRALHAALARELDPGMLIGGSSYAEITPAGVSRDSVAVLLLEAPGTAFSFARARLGRDSGKAGAALARALTREPDGCPFALVFGGIGGGRATPMLNALHAGLPGAPLFGGMASGDHDAGMGDPRFNRNWQYGPRLETDAVVAALMTPPEPVRVGFGFDHGWSPVGPMSVVTRARGGRVLEVDGMTAVDYYRQFFGLDACRDVLTRSVQRYAFALQLEGEHRGKTLLKLPVDVDFKKGWIDYLPAEDLQGRRVQLLAATRAGVVGGARRAAERARDALRGKKASLVLAVSCCTRGAFLNSRIDTEMDAARAVFGRDTPFFGYYSGGEFLPFLSRYEEAADPSRAFGGSYYHAATVGFLALSVPGGVRASAPKAMPYECRAAARAEDLLARAESALEDEESFLANLSRKNADDTAKLTLQTEVIRRYTPHGVWRAVGRRAARGVYELPDCSFAGAFLFMDVKGFTSYSEKHRPREVVAALNRIMDPATRAIHARGGDVDKYIGDCIFAS